MKKLSLFHSALVALMLTFAFTACSSDDDDDPATPQPEQPAEPEVTYHYDLTVTVGKHGGMASQETHLTTSVPSLADATLTVDFKGNGVEITDYTIENIYDAKYMYQVPTSEDRFAKLQLKDNKLSVIRERPFGTNTFAARKYTHAWLNDNTLLIMAANGKADKIIWTKLNTDDMTIISEARRPSHWPRATTHSLPADCSPTARATTSCSTSTTARRAPAARPPRSRSSMWPSSTPRPWPWRRTSSTRRLPRCRARPMAS